MQSGEAGWRKQRASERSSSERKLLEEGGRVDATESPGE